MTLTGFEPLEHSSGNTACPANADAESDAVLTQDDAQSPLDALAAMIAKLTPDDRAKLVGMLKDEKGEGDGR